MQTLHPNVLMAIGAIFALLVVSTCCVYLLKRKYPTKDFGELEARVKTWWIMCGVFSTALFLSKIVSLCFFALISFLALKEYLTLVQTRRSDRRVLLWAYATVPIQYVLIEMQWYGMFVIFIPLYFFLFIPFRMVMIGDTEGFLKSAAVLHWGVMVTVFCISHLGYLLMLPAPGAGGAGLVLFLVVLTQLNDVSQYVWGKTFGKRKIIPKVSPNKTWEGFLGGLGTTVVLSIALHGLLTPLTFLHAILAGIIIAVFGFIGDVSISALKRDLGIKDSGTLLPGHGGLLDRIDSITYTAPLFFHFVYYFYF